ncbi:unnamed protein product [Enterobius vermicularis]|uniref:Uncharacterized protein n=1 Tax=Enterobius vermicularis TaxID=51028 RepID=A0A0N4UW38_ENTVE|nr:unnamed protein product [Enterobius vermicularis]
MPILALHNFYLHGERNSKGDEDEWREEAKEEEEEEDGEGQMTWGLEAVKSHHSFFGFFPFFISFHQLQR